MTPCSSVEPTVKLHGNTGKVRSQVLRDQIAASLRGKKQAASTVANRAASIRNSPKLHMRARYIARAAGEKTYRPERPCKRGHWERDVKFGECVQCQLDKQRAPEYRSYTMWWTARDRAERLGLPFNLTRKYIEKIWPENEMCPIFGVRFEYPSGPSRGKGSPLPYSPSIDRIRPEKGYVEGNVAIISNRANTMKHNCSDPAVFRRIATWLEEQ